MRIRFDRGTLVLEADVAGEDPSRIPDATWDEESCAWRYPAHLYGSLIARLADTQVRISDELRIRSLDSACVDDSNETAAAPARLSPAGSEAKARGVDSIARRSEWALPDLRWYQTEALAAWERTRRGVLALPTGSGKTLAAISAIAKLAVTTLILVPTRVLLDQWVRVLEALSPHPIGHIGDGERKIEGITVATFASAVIWVPKIGDQFGLVIVDEAHHVGAWCPEEVLEMLPAPHRLGLTATPPDLDKGRRRDDKLRFTDGSLASFDERESAGDHENALTRLVGPVVYSLSIDDLRGNGLADFDLITVPIELAPDERNLYRENRAKFSSVFAPHQHATHGSSWQDFVRDARRTRAGRDALVSWRSYRQLLSYSSGKRSMLRELLALHAGQRTLIFTADVATAYAIARELLVQPITHEIGKAERADVLARFRSGEISALVSAQVLDEGLDVPDADVAIVVGGSASARRHVQRIGRVLRPRDGKRARIYELAVNDSTELSYVSRRRAGLGERAEVGAP
ncbi:DEAD/DEAH box helicase family protein [soil metagenome]